MYVTTTMGRPPSKERLGETIHVKLSDDVKIKLDLEAKAQGIYLSQLIRQILMDYTENLEKRSRGGLMREGEPSCCVDIKDILSSDEFKEQLQQEIHKVLRKMID